MPKELEDAFGEERRNHRAKVGADAAQREAKVRRLVEQRRERRAVGDARQFAPQRAEKHRCALRQPAVQQRSGASFAPRCGRRGPRGRIAAFVRRGGGLVARRVGAGRVRRRENRAVLRHNFKHVQARRVDQPRQVAVRGVARNRSQRGSKPRIARLFQGGGG